LGAAEVAGGAPAAGAGLGAGTAALGAAAAAFDGCGGFRIAGFAVLEAAGAAVPRYGTAVVGAAEVGLDVAGDDAARIAPSGCDDRTTASFLCILTCPFSTGPEALRLSCGVCDAPFAPPAGRGAGLGAPTVGACFVAVAGIFLLVGSIIDIMSLRD
jgi:hypothetical protein